MRREGDKEAMVGRGGGKEGGEGSQGMVGRGGVREGMVGRGGGKVWWEGEEERYGRKTKRNVGRGGGKRRWEGEEWMKDMVRSDEVVVWWEHAFLS